MMAMALQIEHLLNNAEGPMCFIVIVPAWADTPSFYTMEKVLPMNAELTSQSKHFKKVLEFKNGQHVYKEGAQHRSKHQYKKAECSSFAIFLQNEEGASKYPSKECDYSIHKCQ